MTTFYIFDNFKKCQQKSRFFVKNVLKVFTKYCKTCNTYGNMLFVKGAQVAELTFFGAFFQLLGSTP